MSYVARSEWIAQWMIMKGEDRIPTRNGSFKVLFKPWLTRQELENMRNNELAGKFRVIALRVPLEALASLRFAIQRLMGRILVMHPPEKKTEEPRLGNVRIECVPEVRNSFVEQVVIRKPNGGLLEIQFANQDTPFCHKCLWWFHDEHDPECPKFNEPMPAGRGSRGRGGRGRGRGTGGRGGERNARNQGRGGANNGQGGSTVSQGNTVSQGIGVTRGMNFSGVDANANNGGGRVGEGARLGSRPLGATGNNGLRNEMGAGSEGGRSEGRGRTDTANRMRPLAIGRGQGKLTASSSGVVRPNVKHFLVPIIASLAPQGVKVLALKQLDGTLALPVTVVDDAPSTKLVIRNATDHFVNGRFQYRLIPGIRTGQKSIELQEGSQACFRLAVMDAKITAEIAATLESQGVHWIPTQWFDPSLLVEAQKVVLINGINAKLVADYCNSLPNDKQPWPPLFRNLLLTPWESNQEGDNANQDHWPVMAELRMGESPRREAGPFRLNTENLQIPGVAEWCKKHWEDWEQTKEWFDSEEERVQLGFRIVTRAMDAFSRVLARECNKEWECRQMVLKAESRIREDPFTDIYWERKRDEWLRKWDVLQIRQQEVWAKRARERGMALVDRMSKETFRRLCPPRSHSVIRALGHLFNSLADIAEDTEAMTVCATEYYSDILTSRRPIEETLADLKVEGDLWQFSAYRLKQDQRLSLDRPLTLEELKEAVEHMAKGKVPGDDGLPVEFYQATWDQVGPILLKLFNRILDGGSLTEDMCRGTITLLYKKGDKKNVRNWRPISLLNASYKILAKALARRLAVALPDLVKADQGAFVNGRSIAENMAVAVGALEIISKEKRQVLVAMLDLEKAYDRAIRREAARYLWKPEAEEEQNFISKVSWDKITLPKEEGGLTIVDPERQNIALLGKWIQKASTQSEYRNWLAAVEYILQQEFKLRRKEDVWTCIQVPSYLHRRPKSAMGLAWWVAWKRLRAAQSANPSSKEEVLIQPLFDNAALVTPDGPPITAKADSFGRKWMEKGVSRITDIWSEANKDWKTEDKLKATLGRLQGIRINLQALIDAIPVEWNCLLRSEAFPRVDKWYKKAEDEVCPSRVFKIEEVVSGQDE
ncbi:hypothetical protein CBR_g58405 [Chara braunii]|uniref:Reverse transcriptase domain-containing protein n=1 Tax=Chara braunii TaxID=69332 RepID=A0A388MER4_CHABU|nr:hypothetical protein CBR_g58405 [Chara braunii]|eukprot:GBG93050.1 hypothetical protein CBR_g58405 [Chara braunii]